MASLHQRHVSFALICVHLRPNAVFSRDERTNKAGFRLLLAFRWAVAGRKIAEFSLAEQKPEHVLLDDRDAGRVGSAQTVVIDQNRKMGQPALPGFARDIFEDALTERAWMGREVEAFGFGLQRMAKDNTVT